MNRLNRKAIFLAAFVASPIAYCSAAFTAGDLVVVTVGGVTSDGQTVTLNEYNLNGAPPLPAIAHPLPSNGANSFVLSGLIDHDGLLRQTPNGQYLTLGGYRAPTDPTANPTTFTAAVDNRVIAVIDSNWNIDTTTALTDAYDQTTIRAVAATDDLHFYTFGSDNYVDPTNPNNTIPVTSGGLRYAAGIGSNASYSLSHTQTTGGTLLPDDDRGGLIAGGQLYITTGSASSFPEKGAYMINSSLPTPSFAPGADNSQPITGVITTSDTTVAHNGTDDSDIPKSDMVLLDLNPNVPGYDTAYTTGGKKDYEKWAYVNEGTAQSPHYDWEPLSLNKTGMPAGNGDIEELDATITGFDSITGKPTVTLYAATASGVFRITDSGGYDTAFSAVFPTTSLIPTLTAGNLRGITILGEVHVAPEPGSAIIFCVISAIMLPRLRRNRDKTTRGT